MNSRDVTNLLASVPRGANITAIVEASADEDLSRIISIAGPSGNGVVNMAYQNGGDKRKIVFFIPGNAIQTKARKTAKAAPPKKARKQRIVPLRRGMSLEQEMEKMNGYLIEFKGDEEKAAEAMGVTDLDKFRNRVRLHGLQNVTGAEKAPAAE
ncbi:hypothetical protein LCGC14_0145190 [marine sediment metagenome]|uniref:Uncharacterized protein n=1 Tax=marine sediment metagenome TaxID=412755 RepID=A0A0F9VF72_9ZZZZ